MMCHPVGVKRFPHPAHPAVPRIASERRGGSSMLNVSVFFSRPFVLFVVEVSPPHPPPPDKSSGQI